MLGYLVYLISKSSPNLFPKLIEFIENDTIGKYLVYSVQEIINEDKHIEPADGDSEPPKKKRKLELLDKPNIIFATIESIAQQLFIFYTESESLHTLLTLKQLRTVLFISSLSWNHNISIFNDLLKKFLDFLKELIKQKFDQVSDYQLLEYSIEIFTDLFKLSNQAIQGHDQHHKGLEEILNKEMEFIITVISFPIDRWLTDDVNSKYFSERVKLIKKTIELISMLPKCMDSTPVVKIRPLMNSTIEELSFYTIEKLPLIIYHQGLPLEDYLIPLLKALDHKPKVAKFISQIVGNLACIHANTCFEAYSPSSFLPLSDSISSLSSTGATMNSINHKSIPLSIPTLHHSSHLQCILCDKSNKHESQQSQFLQQQSLNDFVRLWEKFFQLASNRYPVETREYFLKASFSRIVRHASVSQMSDKKSFLDDHINYLTDADSSIRKAMSQSITVYISPSISPLYIQSDQYLLTDQLDSLFTQNEKSIEIAQSILSAFGNIGSLQEDSNYLNVILLELIDKMFHSNQLISSFAFDQIKYIAKEKNQSVKELIEQFEEGINPILLERISSQDQLEFVASILFNIKSKEFKQWIKSILPTALPKVLFKILEQSVIQQQGGTVETPTIHQHSEIEFMGRLSELLGKPTNEILMKEEYLAAIVAYFFVADAKGNTREIVLNKLENLMNSKLKEMIVRCGNLLVTRIVFLLDENEDKLTLIKIALKFIRGVRESAQGDTSITPNDRETSDFLSSTFFSIAHSYKDLLRSRQSKLKTKSSALISFGQLIKLLGESLYSLRPKVIVILKLFAKYPPLHEKTCKTWLIFITCIGPQKLGQIIPQVISEILKFIPTSPNEVIKIFNYLLENYDVLHEFLQSYTIPFIPDIPLLANFRKKFLLNMEKTADFNKKVEKLLKTISNSAEQVQRQALDQLKDTIRENNSKFHELINTGDEMVLDVMRKLLTGCLNTKNKEVKLAYGMCIGEVSAIDPNLLDEIKLKTGMGAEKTETELAGELIKNFLINHLKAADDPWEVQNFYEYAIQELLKICGYYGMATLEKSKKEQVTIDKLWKKEFPAEMREILKPFLDSKYDLVDAKPKLIATKSVYERIKSSPDKSFLKWVGQWCDSLIQRATGSKLTIFRACRGVIKHNVELALYLLPYILLDVLIGGTEEDRASIKREILDVLQLGNQNNHSLSPAKHIKPVSSLMKGNVTSTSVASSSIEQQPSPFDQMCMQTIFSVIDLLTSWVNQQKTSTLTKSGRGRKSKNSTNLTSGAISPHKHIEKLLDEDFPQRVLSKASYHSKAYARSLLHYERYIRKEMETKSKTEVFKEAIHDLEKIYKEIDEPDGLVGIETIKGKIMERVIIKEYENKGRWSSALAYYDNSLQQDASNINHQKGRLECLQHLGNLETMLSLVYTPNSNELQTKENSDISCYGVKAAWRLGKWNLVRKYLQYIKPQVIHNDFDVSVGKLLLLITENNEEQFKIVLDDTLSTVIESLSAASMESYKRAYPFIIDLHILRDLEYYFEIKNTQIQNNLSTQQVVQTTTSSIPSNKFNLFKKNWRLRYDATQTSLKSREILLHVHQIVFKSLHCWEETKQCWLNLAVQARKDGQLEQVSSALLAANTIENKHKLPHNHEIQIELAKLEWIKGYQLSALLELQSFTYKLNLTEIQQSNKARIRAICKVLLLEGSWLQTTGQKPNHEIISHYEKIVKLSKEYFPPFPSLSFSPLFLFPPYSIYTNLLPLTNFTPSSSHFSLFCHLSLNLAI